MQNSNNLLDFCSNVSFVCFHNSLGETETVREVYKELFDRGHVNHWSSTEGGVDDKQALILDLHSFSRGMAFGAVSCARLEVKER